MRIVFCVFVLVVSSLANSAPAFNNGERYYWFPDDDGTMRLVDSWDETIVRFSPDEDIKYYLYTRRNPTVYQEIIKGDVSSLLASNFDASKPVKFTIHGWNDDYTASTNTLPTAEFLAISDVNMITVDWSVGASEGYFSSVANTISSGSSVAEFLDWINELGVPYEGMHLIGHSLGGQMTGIIGRNTKGTVEHITSLDPANPSWGPNSQRIRKTDAKYVEIIHTNAGVMGMGDAVGHNDFYPNGGRDMPGCSDFNCSHSRVRQYFAESIRMGKFTSIQCESTAEAMSGVENCAGSQSLQMGGGNIKPELGIFALNTNAASPYSQG